MNGEVIGKESIGEEMFEEGVHLFIELKAVNSMIEIL